MSDRRYSEEEVAAIFERAAEEQQAARRRLPPGEGMTLVELQGIGREVGIAPESVAWAARSLDRSDPPPTRTFLGLPIGVGRSVDLDRRLSDPEWERLVADLRETFDAAGTVSYDGPFRQWSNGNLKVMLEPTETGHRVRLRTVKGGARELINGGLASLGLAGAVVLALLGSGQLAEAWPVTALLGLVGLGMFGAGALRLPGWARLRARQMEAVISRLELETEAARSDDAAKE
jgi:hypothetical protein